MINLDKQLLSQLNQEQGDIINSKYEKIIVSAGPGSGKTYTIVKKISQILSSIEENRGVIACSFTKEASKQLKSKLEMECEKKESFIGTIDSFILTRIIDPYKNRVISNFGSKNKYDKLKIRMPEIKSDSSLLTKQGRTEFNKDEIRKYCMWWKTNFVNGVYEISFPSYLVAIWMIKNMQEVKDYLMLRYDAIFVDEAQDLNEFQHEFIDALIVECGLKSILIGDRNQSIYQFRGARPEQFYSLKDKGYVEYRINVSVRCHKSILQFSNKFVDPSYILDGVLDLRVKIGISPSPQKLTDIDGSYLILLEKNDTAIRCFEFLKNKGLDAIYSKSIQISDKDFKDNYYDIVEETIKFYLNFENDCPQLVYSVIDFIDYLSNFINGKQLKTNIVIDFKDGIISYIEYILGLGGVNIPAQVKEEIFNQLNKDIHINHYFKQKDLNRIMTIHSSKGLEADNVFVRLEFNQYRLTDEYRRKLFVAFSRAKNNLFISYCKGSNLCDSRVDKEIRSILNLLKPV